MTSQVNYIRAAKGAVLATATQLYLNQGSLVNACLFVALADLGIELCNKVSEQMHKIKIYGPEKFEFRILSDISPYPLKNEEEIRKALERIQKEYPMEFKELSERYGLSSEEKLIAYFKHELNSGCCYGMANAIFDKICQGTAASFPGSICKLQNEDVFYHQILQKFLLVEKILPEFLESRITLEATILADKKIIDQLSYTNECSQLLDDKSRELVSDGNWDKEWEVIIIEVREQYQKRIEHLKQNDHSSNFSDSEKFPIGAASSVYRNVFEKVMLAFPNEQDMVGVINLPNHVIGFQHGPRGYFLYDTFNHHKGLFEYFDSDTFFFELREHVLYDIQRIKQSLIKNEKPDAKPEEVRADAEDLLKKVCPHYSIRPLRQINPFIEARELPPVNRPLSEGLGAYFSRKATACTHSLALTSLQAFDYISKTS